jgi:hypothetical protein
MLIGRYNYENVKIIIAATKVTKTLIMIQP